MVMNVKKSKYLGHLDTSSSQSAKQDLPEKSKIELPSWMAKGLFGDKLSLKN